MQEQLIGTYRDLMSSLQSLPDNIAAEQERLEGQERELSALTKASETTEHAYITAAGGWKALGGNDKERELVLAEFRRTDRAMRDLSQQERSAYFAAQETRRVIAALERRCRGGLLPGAAARGADELSGTGRGAGHCAGAAAL